MYQEAETQRGGWDGFKPFTVVKKVKESNVITSFYLKPTDGGGAILSSGAVPYTKSENSRRNISV